MLYYYLENQPCLTKSFVDLAGLKKMQLGGVRYNFLAMAVGGFDEVEGSAHVVSLSV